MSSNRNTKRTHYDQNDKLNINENERNYEVRDNSYPKRQRSSEGMTEKTNNLEKNNIHANNHIETNEAKELDQESSSYNEPYFVNDITGERKVTMNDVAEKLEKILENVKYTTQKLLREIDCYTKSAEKVNIDFVKCLQSQIENKKRLENLEQDVIGATGQFVDFAGFPQGNK